MIYFAETPAARQRATLCQWVERFYDEGKKVQVVADSSLAAQHLDQMLWTFSETSFVAHRILPPGARDQGPEPVVITVGEVDLEGFEVLVCDGPVRLDFMKRYPVTVHFVVKDDEERKQQSRLLWLEAREQGLQVQHVPYATPRRYPD